MASRLYDPLLEPIDTTPASSALEPAADDLDRTGSDDAEVSPAPVVQEPGPSSISFSRLLAERPDVAAAYANAISHNDPQSDAWIARVGGSSAEAYAKYWYASYGRFEGYNQGSITAGDNVSVEKLLQDRPDVLRAFYAEYSGAGNDRHSNAWIQRIGGDTPEAYARYWYDKYGKWEGYAQTDKAAWENVDVERLLTDRPDVMRAFYSEYYGPRNDLHSDAWLNRVGGETVQDYAKYWFNTYGRGEGYNQHPAAAPSAPAEDDPPTQPSDTSGSVDPSLDPWNHPAIYPDWKPPYEGWEPPTSGQTSGQTSDTPAPPADEGVLAVGQALGSGDLFG